MRTLLLLSLWAMAAVCTAAPQEISGPSEKEETFMDKRAANNFVRRKRNAYGYYHHIPPYESVREMYKGPGEVNREYCDDDENCGKGYAYPYYGKGYGYGHGYGYAGYAGYYSPYYHYAAAKHVREAHKSPREVQIEYCGSDDRCGKGYAYPYYGGKGNGYGHGYGHGHYGYYRPYYRNSYIY